MFEKSVYKPGDLVQLKSGGPSMTVNSIDDFDKNFYWCVWFAGSKNQHARFAADTLQKYAAPEKKK